MWDGPFLPVVYAFIWCVCQVTEDLSLCLIVKLCCGLMMNWLSVMVASDMSG